MLHCRPGDEVIVGRGAHTRLYESGAGAAWAGVQFAEVGGADGTFTAADVDAAALPDDRNLPHTRLVAVENTHNRGGGRVWPRDAARGGRGARARARPRAAPRRRADLERRGRQRRSPERELAAPFDTVSVCFSKGLGAPVGSVLAGGRADVERARRFRKMLGGGMRQAGILCAAALYALEHHRERLAEDHANARRLADGLAGVAGVGVDPAKVETNIVIFEVAGGTAAELARRVEASGVRLHAIAPTRLRAVTHLDVDAAGIDRAIAAVRAALAARQRRWTRTRNRPPAPTRSSSESSATPRSCAAG